MDSIDADDTSESTYFSVEEPKTEMTYVYDVPSPCSEDFDTDLEDSGESFFLKTSFKVFWLFLI